MTADKVVFSFSGAIILLSLALGFYVHPYWYAVTAFMGADLMQVAFTGFCPLAFLVRKIGIRAGAAFD